MRTPREYLQQAAPDYVRDSLPAGTGIMPIADAERAIAAALADADRYQGFLLRALRRPAAIQEFNRLTAS